MIRLRRPKLKLRIRWKLLAVLLVLVGIGIGLTDILWFFSVRPILQEKIVHSQETLAANAAFRVEEIVRAKVRNLILHSQTTAFLEKNLPAVEHELSIILRQDGDLEEISFLDEHGQELAKLTPEKVFAQAELKSRSEDAEFLIPSFRYGVEYIGPVRFDSAGEPFLTIAVPVVLPNLRQQVEQISTQEPGLFQRSFGEIRGVLTAQASLKDLLRANSEVFHVEGGSMYLVDKENRLIDHTNVQPPEGYGEVVRSQIVQEHQDVDEKLQAEIGGHPFQHILTSEGLSAQEEKVLATFFHVPSFRWGLVVEESTARAFAPLNRVGKFALLLFLAGIGITIVVSFWFSYRLTRPIRTLKAGAEKIGKGKLGTRVALESNDEIQQLAEALNSMAQSLQESRARDKEISRMKSEFLSITAHQLRTPLSALKWVLHMSLEGDVGKLVEKQRELLQKGYDANERMINLVNDLLDVVRIEEGRFQYTFRKVRLVELLEKALEGIRIIAEQKGVKIEFHKPSRAIPQASVDEEKFRLAVMNIIDNAIQYTPKGGRVNVEVTWQDEVLVVVRDTGIGIPKAQRGRLFSKFFRAPNAVRMETSGSGLGLFITKNIIEKHGGNIWIESEEGKGTSVYFTIPAAA